MAWATSPCFDSSGKKTWAGSPCHDVMQRITPPFLAAALILGGCGYSHPGDYNQPAHSGYQWHSLYREDVQTVAVPAFTTRAYRRGVEFSLSKAVINQLEAHSPYKVVPRERADTVLEGEITRVDVANLSQLYNENVP